MTYRFIFTKYNNCVVELSSNEILVQLVNTTLHSFSNNTIPIDIGGYMYDYILGILKQTNFFSMVYSAAYSAPTSKQY